MTNQTSSKVAGSTRPCVAGFTRPMTKRLRVEPLEKRVLLAADVFVSIVDGDLAITAGDMGADLDINVCGSAAAGFSASVANLAAGGSVYVNGELYVDPHTGLSSAWHGHFDSGNVHVVTGNGDDTIHVNGFSASISVDAGDGNDRVDFWATAADIAVNMGAGVDSAEFGQTTITGQLTLDAGEGNDVVVFRGTTIQGAASLQGSEGEDRFTWLDLFGEPQTEFGDVTVEGFEHLPTGLQPPDDPDPVLYSNVTVEVIDGNLVIMGDEFDNRIDVVRTEDGGYRITGQRYMENHDGIIRDTAINGQDELVVYGVTGDVLVSLGDGNDEVGLAGLLAGDLTVDTGAGNDSVKLYQVEVLGDVSVETGVGDDVVVAELPPGWALPLPLDPIPLPPVDVPTAASPEDVADEDLPYRVVVHGSVTINMGNGRDGVVAESLDVRDDLQVLLGSGDDWISLGGDCSAPSAEFSRNVIVTATAALDGGSGTDSLNEDYLAVNTAGGWVVSGFENVDDYVSPAATSNVTVEIIDGNLVIMGGETDDYVSVYCNARGWCWVVVTDEPGLPEGWISGSFKESSTYYVVTGDVFVSLGDGDDYISLRGFFAGSVNVDTGAGNDGIGFVSASIEGDLSIVAGSGDDSLDTTWIRYCGNVARPGMFLSVGGDMTLDMMKGDDRADLSFVKIEGTACIDTATGDDFVRIGASLFAGDLNIVTAEGADQVRIVALETVDSFPHIIMWPTEVQGSLTIDTGDADDEVLLRQTIVDGDVRIETGIGDDIVHVTGLPESYDEMQVKDLATAIHGSLVISTGAGNDEVRVTGLYLNDDIQVDTDAGNDDVSLQWIDVAGTTWIGTSDGNDKVYVYDARFQGFVRVATSTGNDAVALSVVQVAGTVVVETGTDADEVHVWSGDIQGDLTIRAGEGDDRIGTAASVIRGQAIWDTADGNDVVHVDMHGGGLQLATGDGNDEIRVSYPPDSFFAQSFLTAPWSDPHTGYWMNFLESCFSRTVSIDAGMGNDVVSIYQSSYARDLNVRLGSGDDALVLGSSDNGPVPVGGDGTPVILIGKANVVGTARLDGGPGIDTLNEDYLDLNTAGGWVVAGFENVGGAGGGESTEPVPGVTPRTAPVVGPVGRGALDGARRRLADVRRQQEPAARSERAAVSSPSDSLAAQAAAHDAALRDWNATTSRRRADDKDDDELLLMLVGGA